MLDKKAQKAMMVKLKFVQNMETLDVTNNSLNTVIFDSKEMLAILDLRLMRYYKIKQGVLQQNLSKYYRFESANILCGQFNKFVNTLKKEKEETKEKYPWLEKDNKRRNMTDREILDKCIDLDKSCLLETEKRYWTCYINMKMHLVLEMK